MQSARIQYAKKSVISYAGLQTALKGCIFNKKLDNKKKQIWEPLIWITKHFTPNIVMCAFVNNYLGDIVTWRDSAEVWSWNTLKKNVLPTYLVYQNLFCGTLISPLPILQLGLKLECICWTGKSVMDIIIHIQWNCISLKVNNVLWSNFVSGIHVHDFQTCFHLNLQLK